LVRDHSPEEGLIEERTLRRKKGDAAHNLGPRTKGQAMSCRFPLITLRCEKSIDLRLGLERGAPMVCAWRRSPRNGATEFTFADF